MSTLTTPIVYLYFTDEGEPFSIQFGNYFEEIRVNTRHPSFEFRFKIESEIEELYIKYKNILKSIKNYHKKLSNLD